jgi:flagellin
MQTALERLSSGDRINHSSDDVAGLAISEHMRGQIKGLQQAERNAQDAVSLVQVAEGGFNEVNNMLVRLRELAMQSTSDSIGDMERTYLDFEAQQLVQEVDRVANTVQLNGSHLLNGSGTELTFQVGITPDEESRITFDTSLADVRASTIGIDGLSIGTADDALSALETVDEAINNGVSSRAIYGAAQSRFNSVINTTNNYRQGLEEANSRIRDANYAEETARLAHSQILTAAGTAVLAQANANAGHVLKLIG